MCVGFWGGDAPDAPLMADEETGKPVEPDTNKPVDQNNPFRPPVQGPIPANPL